MFKLVKKYMKPYWWMIVLVIILQSAQTICTLYLPNLNAHIIDNGVVKGDVDYIKREGIIMLSLAFLQVILLISATYFGARAALSMGRDIRKAMFYQVETFSTRELSKFGAPTLITRSTNDVQQVQQISMFMLTLIISSPIMFIGGIILSLEQDVALSGVVAATFPVMAIVAAFFVSRMTPYFKKFQKKIDRMNEVLREQISGVRVVRAFVRENSEQKRFDVANDDLYNLQIKTGRLMSMLFPIFMFVVNLSVIAIMWFGGIRINNGQMEIGSITAFITYMMYIMMAVLMSSMVFVFLPRAEVSSKRIREVLRTKTTIKEVKSPRNLPTPLGVLEFKNVEFRYSGATEPVLKNISFKASPGQFTAIIGSTGCGKSTLLRLIPRLSDTTGGDIFFDGVNIRELSLDKLNSYISVVPQKSFLFSGTLADNLRFGKEDATDEEMWEALDIAMSTDFVKEKAKESNIKNPLEIPVSQGGTNFSGGQRQRLAIARAIIRKPFIYQFDDSFSALDYKTDHDLRQELFKITKNSTVIVVAQRVSTIRHADQILVMDNGEIVGRGTHEQLLKSCETYQEIVNSQLSADEALK